MSNARARSLLEAFFAEVIFNLGNLLLVAAISVAGMAVAFPIGSGLALVIGAVINYVISPKGNPILLLGGIALICIAILFDALAYRGVSGGGKASAKGVGLSLACGVAVGLFGERAHLELAAGRYAGWGQGRAWPLLAVLNCKAHDLDNLYVVDASFFVSIAADALRVGDHLLARLG